MVETTRFMLESYYYYFSALLLVLDRTSSRNMKVLKVECTKEVVIQQKLAIDCSYKNTSCTKILKRRNSFDIIICTIIEIVEHC